MPETLVRVLSAEPVRAIIRGNRGVGEWEERVFSLAAGLRATLKVEEILPEVEMDTLIDPLGSSVLAGMPWVPEREELQPRLALAGKKRPARHPVPVQTVHTARERGSTAGGSAGLDVPASLAEARQVALQPAILLSILQRYGDLMTAKTPAVVRAATSVPAVHPVTPVVHRSPWIQDESRRERKMVPLPVKRGVTPPQEAAGQSPVPSLSVLVNEVGKSTAALLDQWVTKGYGSEAVHLLSQKRSASAEDLRRILDGIVGGGDVRSGSVEESFAAEDWFSLQDRAGETGASGAEGGGRRDISEGTRTARLDDIVAAVFTAVSTVPASGTAREADAELLITTLERIVEHLSTTGTSFSEAAAAISKAAGQKDEWEGPAIRWLGEEDLAERLNGILRRQAKRRGIDLP